jgi:D-amino peptidase
VERISLLRVGYDAPTMTEAMKAFKIVTNVAGGAVEKVYG